MSLSLVASLWSLKTGRLSKVTGLDWEVYLILFCCVGLALMVQAMWAVARLKPGDRFDSTAFAVASFTSMAPIISDFYDTLKDVIFGALCLQSEHLMIQILGMVSWLHLFLFHAWFLLMGDKDCSRNVIESLRIVWLFGGRPESELLGKHCFAELASSHLSVLLTSPKVPGEWSGGCTATGCWEGTVLPILYKQLTPSKREYLLIENLPQAVFSVLFLLAEGGSFFVGVLNLLVPGVQILLTFLCFEPVLPAAAPALGKKLNRAMRSGDMVAAAFLWEDAELGHSDNLQLFGLILPRLTFFLDTLSRHGFNKDPTKLNEEELAMVQRIGEALVDSGQVKSYGDGRNLGELGAKVVAEAMTTDSVTHSLDLDDNNMGDPGAQALAESLKINRSLRILRLGCNNIGAAGAEALAESLKTNSSLTDLSLYCNNIGNTGAQALGESLKSNSSLKVLDLQENNIGTAGAEALAESLKINVTLTHLGRYCNNIGNTGAQALAESLKTNRSLRILWLSGNNIGNTGAQALAESLKTNRSLRILLLEVNNIGAAGAQALAESLKINITLENLYLQRNNIGTAGALALAAGLLQNRGLRTLVLTQGSVGDEGDEGRQALEDAEKTKKERGEDFEIVWWS